MGRGRMKAFFRLSSDLELIPHNQETLDWMSKRKAGEIISADIKQVRNYENLKRFFSFVNDTFDMQDHFTAKEAYRRWLTMKAGYFSTLVTPKGDTLFIADSVSFEKMNEEEFKKMFNTCIDVFLQELGKGISESDLMRAINYG